MIAIIVSFMILGAGITLGFFIDKNLKRDAFEGYIRIMGDVKNPGRVGIMTEDFEIADNESGSIRKVCLSDVLQKAGPLSPEYMIYLIGADGRAAAIKGEDSDSSYLLAGAEGLFDAVNPVHPVSTNIKGIDEVIIVSTTVDLSSGFNIITPEKNIDNITLGEAYIKRSSSLGFEGSALKDTSTGSNQGWVYQRRETIDLKDWLDFIPEGPYIAMGKEGGYYFGYDIGKVEMTNEGFKLSGTESSDPVEDLVGIMLEAPAASIMDVYHDSLAYTQAGERVMVILVDGFSYQQFEKAMAEGYLDFDGDQVTYMDAVSVYKPVTNSGLAAMLTGKPPYLNGIYSRDKRQLAVTDMFEVLESEGKSSVYFEGDIGPVDTSLEPILHTDKDGSGSKDDEIFESALDSLDEGYDMMFIHFHGLDDRGHEYGDMDKRTLDYISTIDSYIEELASGWEGKMIITSDHGMHSIDGSGSHGEFRFEDMIVPYIVMEGKK